MTDETEYESAHPEASENTAAITARGEARALEQRVLHAQAGLSVRSSGTPGAALLTAEALPQVGIVISTYTNDEDLSRNCRNVLRRAEAFQRKLKRAETEFSCITSEETDGSLSISSSFFDETLRIPPLSMEETPTHVRALTDFVDGLKDLKAMHEETLGSIKSSLDKMEHELECRITQKENGTTLIQQDTYGMELIIRDDTPAEAEKAAEAVKTMIRTIEDSDTNLTLALEQEKKKMGVMGADGEIIPLEFSEEATEDGTRKFSATYKHFITGKPLDISYETSPDGRISALELQRFMERVREFDYGRDGNHPPLKEVLKSYFGISMDEIPNPDKSDGAEKTVLFFSHPIYGENANFTAPAFYRLPQASALWSQFQKQADPNEQKALLDRIETVQNAHGLFSQLVRKAVNATYNTNGVNNKALAHLRQFARDQGYEEQLFAANDVGRKQTLSFIKATDGEENSHDPVKVSVMRLIDFRSGQSFMIVDHNSCEAAWDTFEERHGTQSIIHANSPAQPDTDTPSSDKA